MLSPNVSMASGGGGGGRVPRNDPPPFLSVVVASANSDDSLAISSLNLTVRRSRVPNRLPTPVLECVGDGVGQLANVLNFGDGCDVIIMLGEYGVPLVLVTPVVIEHTN